MNASHLQENSDMAEKREINYAALGMLAGIAIGGGWGVTLFATTGNAVYFAVAGMGAALGLLLGAGYARRRRA